MVNVKADNDKLRTRSARIVSRITGVPEMRARHTLELCGGEVKPAILLAAGARDVVVARALLAECSGNVRTALGRLASA
jgi:N-acetylmuramic acid 6-phosphate etherase